MATQSADHYKRAHTPPVMKGMAEAERQFRVARRLYEKTRAKKAWDKLKPEERRPFIDLSCQGPHRDDDGY